MKQEEKLDSITVWQDGKTRFSDEFIEHPEGSWNEEERNDFCCIYIAFFHDQSNMKLKEYQTRKKSGFNLFVVISKANKKIDFIPVELNSRKFNLSLLLLPSTYQRKSIKVFLVNGH